METAEIIVGVSGFLECDSDITAEPESPTVVLHAHIGDLDSNDASVFFSHIGGEVM